MNKIVKIFVLFIAISSCKNTKESSFTVENSKTYTELKQEILKGWNTWNTNSVLSHINMPEGLAVSIYINDLENDTIYKIALPKPAH